MNISETGNKKPEIQTAAEGAAKAATVAVKPSENLSDDAAKVSVSLRAKEEAPRQEEAAAPAQNPAVQKYKQIQDSLVS